MSVKLTITTLFLLLAAAHTGYGAVIVPKPDDKCGLILCARVFCEGELAGDTDLVEVIPEGECCPRCVPRDELCRQANCNLGQTCEIILNQAQCVPAESCAAVQCPSGTACEVINGKAICKSSSEPSDFLCRVQGPFGPPCKPGERCSVVGGDAIVCTPDCSVDNGGCPGNSTCRIDPCFVPPCPVTCGNPPSPCETQGPFGPPCKRGERCSVVGGDAVVCTPDCSVDNGGCPVNSMCIIEQCRTPPCPVACIDPPSPCETQGPFGPPCKRGERCSVVGGDAIVCTPDCSVDNGGCPANKRCIIEQCRTPPCPVACIDSE